MGTANLTLYAQWIGNNNTIIFNANGGIGSMSDQIIASGTSVNLTTNSFTRAGYSFSGWNSVANGSGTAYADSISYLMGTTDLILYAQWTANNNTVIFNANGGIGSMSNQTIASGASANLTANSFTRGGYTFSAWNTLANGSGTAYANSASYLMGTANLTLYAQWTANNNTITFNSNGGTGSMANQIIATGASANLTVSSYTWAGYSFNGWNTLANGSGTAYADSASYLMGTANLTLYAQWTSNSHTITFIANGGSGSMSNQTITSGVSANLTANSYTQAGYTFSAWNSQANGSGTSYANSASYLMGTSNVTLYAQWTANNNTITFDANGGFGSMSNQIISTGASANLIANTFSYAVGYSFSGWNTLANGSGIAYAPGANYPMGTTNVTLYAQWKAAGSTWTARTLPSSLQWTSVAYGNGVFVALSTLSSLAASSPDGITWTTRSLPSSNEWISVIYGNGLFVAVAANTTVTATSPDGINWTAHNLASTQAWRSVTYGNGMFVAVAANTTVAVTSPDGITWTARTLPSASQWWSVTYGNGNFVAIAENSAAAASSSDGITWTTRNLPYSATWTAVTYGDGQFVAVASGSSAATSPDGITWTAHNLPSARTWQSVAYGNGVFVAVAQNTSVAASSVDGVTWTSRTLPSSQYWFSIAYGNGVFVTIAYASATAATSP